MIYEFHNIMKHSSSNFNIYNTFYNATIFFLQIKLKGFTGL